MASNISKVSIREEANGWIRVKRFQELFKIVLLGDSGVGKTSLGYQYAEEKVLQKPQLTVGFDYWTKEIGIEGETVKVSLVVVCCNYLSTSRSSCKQHNGQTKL